MSVLCEEEQREGEERHWLGCLSDGAWTHGGDTWHNVCTEATRTQELFTDSPENKMT